MKIGAAYMEKALSWPSSKAEDVGSLQAHMVFLRGCCNMMESLQYMADMNVPSNLKQLVMKLPYKLRERWKAATCDLQEAEFCSLI